MNRKRITVAVLMAFLAIAALSAQNKPLQATIGKIAGKVEVQLPGKDWRPAKEGEILPKGTMVSTGFKSTAVLTVSNSNILVKPVTRMKLEEIVQTQSGTNTQVYLSTGKLSVEVTPQQNQTTDFTVSSPTATASVRGTGFDFDGEVLIVRHGVVELKTPVNQTRLVGQDQISIITPDGASMPVVVTGDATSPGALTETQQQQQVLNYYNAILSNLPYSVTNGAALVFILQ